ncbi:hypothetical protein [Rouxiella sp. WC2420]|uniref:Uncharacterized protein n=1 Tax=Rouxiella sp. WC2420 TaxID=3234145 RepID=A0AB39VKG7_9GAMM
MTKFDEYMEEFAEDASGMTIKRRHTFAIPLKPLIEKIFSDAYQRGYDDAIRQAKPKPNEAA